jgi:acyl-CoA oxidase
MEKFGEEEKPKINSPKDFDDLNILKSIFEHRVNFFLQKSVTKLASLVEKKEHQMTAWNKSQPFFLQNLARAYGENYTFNCFKEKLENMQSSSTKDVLFKFLKLYSLVIFENDSGNLRYDNFIESETFDIIKDEILELCEQLKDEVIGILDIISFPDFVLDAPFGASDGKYMERYFNKILNFKFK